MNDGLGKYRQELRARCRGIHGHGKPDATAELARVAAWCAERDVPQDVYGEGAFLNEFEARVAALLGLEAARFVPSGKVAQAAALRIWCGAGGHFGMHPTCHVELHEERGYSHLLGLRATLVGQARRVMLAKDLAAVAEPLDALVVELPTRENGGRLPAWEELVELCALARRRGTKLHLDGARLWEAQAAYGRPFPEITALFDSVYVSFYKGIGALPGAMLLGSRAFVDEAKLWQKRLGATLYTLLPSVASAAMHLDERLPRFPAWLARARALAAALAPIAGLTLLPDPPQVNMVHVLLDLAAEDALAARDRVAEATGLWLFGAAAATDAPGRSRFELYVGEAALEVGDDELAAAFAQLFA
ncbi:MAG: threonine aldolase [Planctomycetes bacterium]|nr:threonine aldolase [Planctomycetota bacterium]